MDKFLNISVLLIFLNFLALPSIARVFDIDIPQTNIVLSEEESSPSIEEQVISEKAIPKPLNIWDFIKENSIYTKQDLFIFVNDRHYIEPYHSIISPPPEYFVFS